MRAIKVLFIFSVFFNISSSCYAGDDFPAGKYRVDISSRPSSPYPPIENYNQALTEHGTGPEFTVPVTRHHIIPYHLLRSFYNMVTTNGDLARLYGFLRTMSNNIPNYASYNAIDCSGGAAVELSSAATLAEAFGWSYVIGGGHTIPPGLDTFQQFYAWLPGNLFVGPSLRWDDPGDGFEENAEAIVGHDRFNVLQRIYNDLTQYVENRNHSVLPRLAANIAQLATVKRVYPLDKDKWTYEGGKYQLRNPYGLRTANSDKEYNRNDEMNEYNDEVVCPAVKSNFKKMRAKMYSVLSPVHYQ